MVERKTLKRPGIIILSMIGFLYAIWGFVNQYYIQDYHPRLYIDSILLSKYSEIFVILIFGIWRILVEKNKYTRTRMITLMIFIATMWGMLPIFLTINEFYIGYLPSQPTFPAIHVPGAITFFIFIALVLLFGRRVVCGWCCPCVGIRETVGAPFRENTKKGKVIWRLRHLKLVFFAYYILYFVLIFFPPSEFSSAVFTSFLIIVPIMYFMSFLFTPIIGNRNWCRFLCPYGGLYGLLNKAGFYKIVADKDKCINCKKCERVCDMGIPVEKFVQEKGEVKVADCTGCGRCVSECPKNVLSFSDVRNIVKSKTKK